MPESWRTDLTWEQASEQLMKGWPVSRATWPDDRCVEAVETDGRPVVTLFTESGSSPYRPTIEDMSATDWVSFN